LWFKHLWLIIIIIPHLGAFWHLVQTHAFVFAFIKRGEICKFGHSLGLVGIGIGIFCCGFPLLATNQSKCGCAAVAASVEQCAVCSLWIAAGDAGCKMQPPVG